MYYIIKKDEEAVGPFRTRDEAYHYADEQNLVLTQYYIATDRTCQQYHQHLPIKMPDCTRVRYEKMKQNVERFMKEEVMRDGEYSQEALESLLLTLIGVVGYGILPIT